MPSTLDIKAFQKNLKIFYAQLNLDFRSRKSRHWLFVSAFTNFFDDSLVRKMTFAIEKSYIE